MASRKGKELETAAVDGVVPFSIIAQAEAAIVGNLEDDEPEAISRQASRIHRPVFSRSGTQSSARSVRPDIGPSKSHNLQVPTDAPPAYSERRDQLDLSQDGFDTKAKVTNDGRINININQKTQNLSDLLVPALRNQVSLCERENEQHSLPPGYLPPALGGLPGQTLPPKLNVVIHVVGSRGDVQPFVALGKTLKATYGHRVRLATHPTFKGFVEENGLEFFSIGGDPSELMAFMLKNPGLMPGFDSLKSGDVGKRRKGMEEIVWGCWRSCIETGDGLGAPPKTSSTDSLGTDAGFNMDANPGDRPFIADAIIANPPSFAHVHIAEKLGIPLHMMFTMPWSPTQQFPHPLANIQSSNADVNMTNFVSYALVEMMTWQGLGDVINRFRERALGLEPISVIWAPGMLSRLRVPYTYCWSPALIPKPKDWAQHISISGFYFLSLASSFTPEPELAAYLAAGPPPVYIGFGSIVVDDPDAMTRLIFEAVKKAGIRALVSKGWGGLGADALGVPEGVFMLGNVPHDWLFQHVSAVVHHGGAGTTAAGIATGKPTVVVPFFGDQPFWGAMVARAGAGPAPIPYAQLTATKLAAAITEALRPETLERAKELGAMIKEEKGCETGAKAFHDFLDVDQLRCSLAPSRVAVWRVRRTQTRLSALAANVLASEGLLSFGDLKLYRPREYETDEGPWDPLSGAASALLGSIASLGMGVADFPIEIFKSVKRVNTKRAEAADVNSITSPRAMEHSSGSTTTASETASRSGSRVDLDLGKTDSVEETPSINEHAFSPTPRTSYDSAARSSNDAPGSDTSLASVTSNGSSLKQALRGTLARHSSGPSAGDRPCSISSLLRHNSKDRLPDSRGDSPSGHSRKATEEFDPSRLTLENASRAGKGISRIVGAGLKSPMDFTLGIARGFHNAPKLYGDDTVRPQGKVTDFQSGLKAAGKEFGYGFYDGFTGLVTQPLKGAEKDGSIGLVKGMAKGIGGLVLKPVAAIWALPGYTFMGIHKEVRKRFGSSVLNYMITARTAQGYEDAQASTPAERADIITQWREHKDEYQSTRMKILEAGPDGQESGHLTPKGFMQTIHMTLDERKKLHEDRKARRKKEDEESACSQKIRDVQAMPVVSQQPDADQDQSEHALHGSAAATSRSNEEEDGTTERAIRASVVELQSADDLTEKEALDRAIQASIASAGQPDHHPEEQSSQPITKTDDEAEHQAALANAIQASLSQCSLPAAYIAPTDDADDEDLKLAIQRSKQEGSSNAEDSELELALQKSKEVSVRAQMEEDTVLEYVKKQSLAEEKFKQMVKDGQEAVPVTKELDEEPVSQAEEEALRQAIKESMESLAL